MQSIYNKQGETVGWLADKDIYNTSGAFIGFVIDHRVYNIKSEFCGSLKQSVFRDLRGLVVAFMKGAKKISHLPALKPSSHEPFRKPIPLLKKVGKLPPLKPYKASWSKLDWSQYIS